VRHTLVSYASYFSGLHFDPWLQCEQCRKRGIAPAGEFRGAEEDLQSKQTCRTCGYTFELGADEKKALHERTPTALIVTTADLKAAAVSDRLEESYLHAIGKIPVKIGEFGGRVVALCQTRQGSTHTQTVVSTLLGSDELKGNVKMVLPVGVAWGAKTDSQRVGDILVASKFVDAGHVRAGGNLEIRGDVRTSPLADTVNSFVCAAWPSNSETHFGESIRIPEHPRRPKAHVGTVISLPELIDDKKRATSLIEHHQIAPHKPIGGEMELYQIVAATGDHGVPWFLSKGISDYAGLAGAKNKEDQPLAAAAAAHFAGWLLRQSVLDEHLNA